MKANELRIGNLVYYHIVDKLNEPEEWDAENIVDCFDIAQMVENPESNEYKPIPLTEEWLRKFGFDDKEYKKGFIGIDVNHMNFVLTKPHGEYDHDCFVWEYKNDIWPKYNEFKYVHQLQNFYYDLTGKELTL